MKKPNRLGIDYVCRGRVSRKDRNKLKKERSNQGYSFWDLADMDMYLIQLIPDMLDGIRAHKYCIPRHVTEDRDLTVDEWEAYLLQTAAKFRAVEEFIDTFPKPGELSEWQAELRSKLSDAFDSLQEYFFSLWI